MNARGRRAFVSVWAWRAGAGACLMAAACAGTAPITKIVDGRVITTRFVPSQAYEHGARAMLFENDERWEDAAAEYQRALSYDGDAPELNARLGEVFVRLDRLADADEAIARSLRLGATPTGFVARAHLLQKKADTTGAVAALVEARALVSLANDSEQAEDVITELGDAQLLALDLAGAAATFDGLAQALPQSTGARMRHAAVAWAAGDMARAEARLVEALAIEPSIVEAQIELGWLRAALGRDDGARAAFHEALDRSEGDLTVAATFARFLVGKGAIDEARQMADDLAGPNIDVASLAQRMELERTVKRPDKALALAAELRKDEPDEDVKAKITLAEGIILEDAGRTADALAAYLGVPENSDDAAAARMRAAGLLRDEGKTADAGKLLAALVADVGDDTAALVDLTIAESLVDEKAGDATHAARRLEALSSKLTTRDELFDRLTLARAAVEDRRGDWRHALALTDEVLRRDVGNVEALNLWGFVAADRDHELPLAQKRLEIALALEPGSAAIIDSVGWVHLRAGDLARAQAFLEQAARLTPDDPEVVGHLGQLYAKRADKPRATATLRRALGLKPDETLRKRLQDELHALEATEAAKR